MLKKEFIYSYLSQIITLLGGVFFLIFLPKFAGVEEYGKFMLILSYISLLGIFMGVPLQEAVKKELVEEKNSKIGKKYISTTYILRIFINIIFFVIFYFLYKNLRIIGDIDYVYIIGIFLFINISGLPQNIFFSLHQNKNNFLFVLIEYVLQIIFILYFYFSDKTLSLEEIILSFIVGYSFSTIFFSVYIFSKNNITLYFEKQIAKTLLSRMIWLSLSSLSFVLLTNIDNIMISYFFDEENLGFYNIATNIINKSSIFTIAIVTTILPLFHQKQEKKILEANFRKYSKNLLLVNIAIALGFFIFSPLIIHIIYGNNFELSIQIMKVIFLFPLFVIFQSFFSGILINFGEYKLTMKISLFIAFVNIILNIIFANIFGIIGISLATIFSYALWSGILGAFVYRIFTK